MTDYVVGFAMDDSRVALIRKNRPDWQRGKLNGIGGHIEDGELAVEAMRREFREETGVRVNVWDHYLTMNFPGATIWFYRAWVSYSVMDSLQTTTDEEVVRLPTENVPWLVSEKQMIPNLAWLIPLAGYTADVYAPILVSASSAETL